MISQQSKTPELLAPAGGLTAFFAALEAGADAIYCGFENFSARAKAKNFSITDLAAMADYVHLQHKKIYVALNTLIKEQELSLLIETLGQLEESAIDGVIVQDLALWRMIKNHFPNLPLHASTQMTVHNSGGVNMLAGMGFKRVVLARELSLAEISAINRETDIELEHFVHGALCFSISGQCFFSSLVAGKSGNRGRCVQPCRWRYKYQGRPGYYFSTSDLCAIEQLPQLIDAGITSFKIEGRMKSAEYVGRVVAAYRMVLDAPVLERQRVMAEARQQLELSFGRRSTTGFLNSNQLSDITDSSQQGTIGQYLGLVKAVRGKTIFVQLEEKLHIGDRLKAMPKNDKNGVGLTVLNLQINSKKVKIAAPGSTVSIETQAAVKISSGDALYKVAAEQAYSTSEVACRNKLAAVKSPSASLVLKLEITPERLIAKGTVAGTTVEKSYAVETYPAKNRPLDKDILARTFAKSGDHPFVLTELLTENLPPVVIPPSRLNEIRRDFFQQLATETIRDEKHRRQLQQQKAMASLIPEKPCQPSPQKHLTVTVGTLLDVAVLDNPLVDRVAVSLRRDTVDDLESLRSRTAGRSHDIIWDIPAIIFPGDWAWFQRTVQRLLSQGFTTFRLNNIGHFPLVGKGGDTERIAGSQLYTMNSETIRAWQELGIQEITLPLENDRQNIAALMARNVGMEICLPIYAPIPLMTSRIPVRGIKPGSSIFSDRSDTFQLHADQGLTILANAMDFSLLGYLDELQVSWCSRFHIDLSHCGPFSAKGQDVLQAFTADRILPETTTFNFERGLE